MHKAWLAAAALVLGFCGSARADVAIGDGKLEFSGKVFADLSYRQNVDDAGKGTPSDGTGLDLKRFYFTADYTYGDHLNARFRSDIGDENGRYDIFVKNAYLQVTLLPALWIRAGSADMPWVPLVEDRYGFRYVENELLDRTGFGTSADWGLHVGGEVRGGLLGYQLSVVNGRGYGDPTRSQAPTLEARISSAFLDHLIAAIGGQVGTLGQKLAGVPTAHTAIRLDGLVAWSSPRVRVGAEGFYGKDDSKSIVTGAALEDASVGVSGWAGVQVAPTLAPTVFARADFLQPSMDVNPDMKELYFDAGIQITPWKPLQLALVYKRDHVSTGALPGTIKTSNATIGSRVTNSGGTYQEVGLWSQLVF